MNILDEIRRRWLVIQAAKRPVPTQRALARKIGIHHGAINQILTGGKGTSLPTAQRLLDELGAKSITWRPVRQTIDGEPTETQT